MLSRPLSAAPANVLSSSPAGFPVKAGMAAPLKSGVLGSKAINSFTTPVAASASVQMHSKGLPLKVVVQQQQTPFKPPSLAQVTKTAQSQMRKQEILNELNLLKQEFERMRVFAASAVECQEDEKSTKDRVTQIDFVLRYIAQVIETVQGATDEQLPQLDQQIKASLLPLKESIKGQQQQQQPPSASASSSFSSPSPSITTIGEASAAPVDECCLTSPPKLGDDAWMSECSTTTCSSSAGSDTGGEVEGLDDLDFECFSLVMDDEQQNDHKTARPITCGPLAELDHGSIIRSGSDEDLTDSASLSSEEAASPQVVTTTTLKRPLEAITPEARPEEELIKRRSLVVPSDAQKIRPTPRTVDYQCGQCSEIYKSSTSLNPWVALEQQECPKCKKIQIPRIDITLPGNLMDYHPALLAEEGDDDSDDEGCGGDDLAREEEDELDDFEEEGSMTAAQASRLVVLMGHARTCPGNHKSPAHAEVCRSVKYLMLHIRDCDGKTLDGDNCTYPWCRAGKLLLNHLVRCYEPDKCGCCSGRNLPLAYEDLRCMSPGAVKQQPPCSSMDSADAVASRAGDLIFGTL